MLRPTNPQKIAFMAVALVFCAAPWLSAQTAPAPPPPPRPAPTPEQLAIQAASEKDHQRMMDLLGIKELRPGASGSANGPNPANYDESKANIYPNLPDPLLLNDGKRVTSAKVWWKQRRPQIVELFDREILGRVPAHLPAVTWKVVSTTQEKNGDIPVITKKLVGHVDNSSDPAIDVDIDLTLTTPANAKGPVPVMMELTFSRQFIAAIARMIPEMAPGANQGPTWQQQLLARGWGYAEYVPTSVQPDNGAGLTQGIIGLANKGQPRALDDWGALRAWAWGASRALDYLATDPQVDASQVGITGHSRYGKAALVAMAYDPRFAIGLHQLFRRGRRQALPPSLRRRDRQHRRHERVSLDGRQLPQIRRPAHGCRPSRRRARADRALRSTPGVHRRRRDKRRRLGRRRRFIPRRCCRRSGVYAAGQERIWEPRSSRPSKPRSSPAIWVSASTPAATRPRPTGRPSSISPAAICMRQWPRRHKRRNLGPEAQHS